MILRIGLLLTSVAAAQTIPYKAGFPSDRGSFIVYLDGRQGPPTMPIAGPPGRQGEAWFVETEAGIQIYGRIEGGDANYARFPAEAGIKDYIGLWLTLSLDIPMPEMGWGDQFGMKTCSEVPPGTAVPEACREWEARQGKYREQLRRLFLRHWMLGSGLAFETYASSAYRQVQYFLSSFDALFFPRLQPALQGPDLLGSDDFRIDIRWSDLPPANELALTKIYVALNFCGSKAPCDDSMPPPLTELTLERPKIARVSPCEAPLEDSWYFPNAQGLVDSIFSLDNLTAGYQYEPRSVSPLPTWKHYFSKSLNAAETVCGPDLSYAAKGRVYRGTRGIDEKPLEFRNLPGGAHLLKSGPTVGPWAALGNGQCGNCDTARVSVFRLDPASGVTDVFRQEIRRDDPSWDGDIQFSPDWRTITVYRFRSEDWQKPPRWSSQRYCLSATEYEECGKGPSAAPPAPRQVHWPQH
jgi:hypothetical protein